MIVIQKSVKDILRKVSKEMDLPYNTIQDIYLSEFAYLKEEINKGERGEPSTFSNILLKYLGTFKISPAKIKYMNEGRLAKEERENEERIREL